MECTRVACISGAAQRHITLLILEPSEHGRILISLEVPTGVVLDGLTQLTNSPFLAKEIGYNTWELQVKLNL